MTATRFGLVGRESRKNLPRSVPARQTDGKRESAHEYEAHSPSRIQIEPAARQELETQIAIDQPCQEAASCKHRERMHGGDQDCHSEIGVDKSACRFVTSVQIGGAAKTQIDRYQHQPGAMRG